MLLTVFIVLSHKSHYSKVPNCFKNGSLDLQMKALQTLAGTSSHQKKTSQRWSTRAGVEMVYRESFPTQLSPFCESLQQLRPPDSL